MSDMLTKHSPARMVAGALAHLARHMATGCPRAAYLAAMLLNEVANDPEADGHLRAHARELVEILERDPVTDQAASRALITAPAPSRARHANRMPRAAQ